MEILTWAQLGIHTKPCVLVNTLGYYDGLLAFLDRAVEQGFLKASNQALIQVARDAEEALAIVNHGWATEQPSSTQDSIRDSSMDRLVT